MLQPKEADIPALFLFLVVLPLVAYILLGLWSEYAKKRERISLLAQLAAEEAIRTETMVTASVTSVVTPPKNGVNICARCFSPATTRCARCKCVRYCSGKCQIIHWRQVHKHECQALDNICSTSSPEASLFGDSNLQQAYVNDTMNSQFSGYNVEQVVMENSSSDNTLELSTSNCDSGSTNCSSVDTSTSQVSVLGRKSRDKQVSRKSSRKMSKKEDGVTVNSKDESSRRRDTNLASSNSFSSDPCMPHKQSRVGETVVLEEAPTKHNVSSPYTFLYEQRNSLHESHKDQNQHGNVCEPRRSYGSSMPSSSMKHGTSMLKAEIESTPLGDHSLKGDRSHNDELADLSSSSDTRPRSSLHRHANKISRLPKTTKEVSGEQSASGVEMKQETADESKVVKNKDKVTSPSSNGVSSMNIMKIMGLRKSTKSSRQDFLEVGVDRHKKIKMLFPYEEFMRFFQNEVLDLSPRGLLNCGNSCYANAVLQCLTCTKPLIIYLLHRSHSRTCYGKDWCLMCELEQHVLFLRETGAPLSPRRILSHMSINCQIGDGSQEDAHEFLRLLVASMQAICLEGLGGEKKVDPKLQETTFIQHTFGGHLCSKVKCLKCYHQSERYENIMDLTLEIYGWVESLEDALTQFTTPEDLDGENMYRCGRCATYVRARKQLSIHEAPNILTIVLKRFEKGRYGKINKCITFPDMLDMVPFMTGMVDIPPLYMLYAVVVHLDTLNASFSGHYVSYVKDLHGNWFRIDDTEVISVPLSQVMSEEAYILFYMRSSPRPQKPLTGKSMREHVPAPARKSTSSIEKLSQPRQHSMDVRAEIANGIHRRANQKVLPAMGSYSPVSMEFSDATSSDWSLFTSSDEASFTTESTRDSFSTIDHTDACNIDPFSSIFNNLYASESPSGNNLCYRNHSSSRAHTRFHSGEKGYMQASAFATQPPYWLQNGERFRQVTDSTGFSSVDNCSMYINYGGNPKYGHNRTSSYHKL